jgi:glycosyltransferase involved in cell wall biosynthesis
MSLRIALTHVYSWPEVARGGERYLHELAAALAGAGHRVRVLSTAPRPGRDQVLGVDVRWLRRRRLAPARFGAHADEVAFGAQALAALAPRRLDVWHALGTADAAAASLLAAVRPGVGSVYSDLGIPAGPSRQRRPDRRLHRVVVDRVGAYVCQSAFAAGYLERDHGRVAVRIPGGVDVDRFRPGPRRTVPTLLFSGAALERRKNVPLLLEAVARLRRRRPDVELWLAGPGDPAPLLAAAPAAAREATTWLGVVPGDDLVGRYAAAWATVLPSEAELFGLAVVESLACGTPVVTLDGSGPAEIVRPGVGFTSAPDVERLADACAAALDLAAGSATADACRQAALPYDWRRSIVPRFEDVYADVRRGVRR